MENTEQTNLKRYLDSARITQFAFARELSQRMKMDINPSNVSRWVRGESMPSILFRRAIDRLTKGAVPADGWKRRG